MADIEIIQDPEDDTLELGEAPADMQAAADDGGAAEPLDTEDFPDTFDEAAGEETPLVKLLREKAKADAREKREMATQLAKLRGQTVPVRTKKPDLWDDCEGDPDKFEELLDGWKANERAVEEFEKAPVIRQNEQAREFEQTRLDYKANAIKLGRPDFATAESAVVETLDNAQQSTILMAAKDPARFIYALGRSPNRLAQLSLITNPIKLAAEVARIEGARVMARQSPPNIDEPVRGSARLSVQVGDAKKDKLIDDAAKNGGDITALLNHDRAKRKAAA